MHSAYIIYIHLNYKNEKVVPENNMFLGIAIEYLSKLLSLKSRFLKKILNFCPLEISLPQASKLKRDLFFGK